MNAAIDFFSRTEIFFGISYETRYVEISILIGATKRHIISLDDKNINPDRNKMNSSLE